MVRVDLPAQRRKESESQRELELTCMSNLMSAAGARFYFKDLQNRFLLVSAGWIAAYVPGQAAKDLIGKTDFDVFSAAHASAASADEERVISTGEAMVGKVELETYAGRTDTWVSTTKMPLRDARGQIIGTFGFSRDVTAQTRAENALAEQALQLMANNERLRELDRLKDEFIGMFAHELRTPLASILGYTEILMEDGVTGPDAEHCVEVIDRNAKRLLRLTEDLQLLHQINSGQLPTEFGRADLAAIVAGVVEEMRPEAERKQIDLVLSATAVPHLAFDPMRIAQLLGNLLSNALKFTPDGGKVEVRLGTEGTQAVLAVADTGIGIPVADRERIFERFFRTAIVERQAIQGAGLGLTISQAIVAAHNGTIAVEGGEGRGSTFTVRLPLLPAPAPGPGEPADANNALLPPHEPGPTIDSTRVPDSTSVAYRWPSMPNWSMAAATRWMRVSSTGPIG
jgi:PAS domain S-box-containing protein